MSQLLLDRWTAVATCARCWHSRAEVGGGDALPRIKAAQQAFDAIGVRLTVSRGCLGLCDHAQAFIVRGLTSDTVHTVWLGGIARSEELQTLLAWLVVDPCSTDVPGTGHVIARTRRARGPMDPTDMAHDMPLKLRVVHIGAIADNVVALTLEDMAGKSLSSWTPGAHIDLCLPHVGVRQYSLCGDPQRNDSWTVAVRREPKGRGGSVAIHERLCIGDVIAARGPRNNFALRPSKKHIFIASGIGITPFIPMVKELEARGESWALYYAGRTRSEMPFAENLIEYGSRASVLPRDEFGSLGIQELLFEPRSGTTVYCCGPDRLIREVIDAMSSWPDGQLVVEAFEGTQQNHDDGSAHFTVVAARSGVEVNVDERTSILEALEASDVYPIAACRGGVCGSCETAVIAGKPERPAGPYSATGGPKPSTADSTLLLCVSRSHTPRMVIDL